MHKKTLKLYNVICKISNSWSLWVPACIQTNQCLKQKKPTHTVIETPLRINYLPP